MKNRIGSGFLLAWLIAGPVQAKDINLGWSGIGSWTTLPYVVANEKGFFDKENLKVQLITFRGTNLMLTALLAGELDYATILPFLTGAASRGLPVEYLARLPKAAPISWSRGPRSKTSRPCAARNSGSIPSAARRIMRLTPR